MKAVLDAATRLTPAAAPVVELTRMLAAQMDSSGPDGAVQVRSHRLNLIDRGEHRQDQPPHVVIVQVGDVLLADRLLRPPPLRR